MGLGGQRHTLVALPPRETPGTRCTRGWVGCTGFKTLPADQLCFHGFPQTMCLDTLNYRGADTSLARPGRKQATAAEVFDVHIFYLLS
jgi:hypothetical protein